MANGQGDTITQDSGCTPGALHSQRHSSQPASVLVARLLTAGIATALALGCSTEPTATTPIPTDTAADSAVADAIESGSDTSADSLADDATTVDDAVADSAASDVRDDDAEAADSNVGQDSGKAGTDALGPGPDVPKYVPPEKPPFVCKSDADCGKGFGVCAPETCNVQTGKCEPGKAPDGTACQSPGVCGTKGVCKGGACVAGNGCAPMQCNPMPIACGESMLVDLTAVSASQFGQYPEDCTYGQAFQGPERVLTLSVDVTQVVTVTLPEGATPTTGLIAIGQPTAGVCNPFNCYEYSKELELTVHPGKPLVFVVDTTEASQAFEVSVVCTPPPLVCGDGTCEGTEVCGNCPKDCGVCPTAGCGDGTCAEGETCASCSQDCGACPAYCQVSTSPGCGACDKAIEQCVCGQDSYCCKNAWDNICVGKASSLCNAPECPSAASCGDNDCDYQSEDAESCPNDCQSSYCGDLICSGTESCTSCPVDCGFCGEETIPPACGNKQCELDGDESCATCPQDCGACSQGCGQWQGSGNGGCDGCACEAAVCAEDSYCCTDYWGSWCDQICEESAGLTCPVIECGDGICMSGEECDFCDSDCGDCTCGDGKCEGFEDESSCLQDCAPECGDFVCEGDETCKTCAADCGPCTCGDQFCAKGETTELCPWDCKHICDTYCGGSAVGFGCYCDETCLEFGDCCSPDGEAEAPSCAGSSCAECNGSF